MSLIPCSGRLILLNLSKSSTGRWWWYPFWTHSTTKESRSGLLIIVVFQYCSVIVTRVSELYSWQISLAGKTLAVATENSKQVKGEKSLAITFYQVSWNICLPIRIHTCWQFSNMQETDYKGGSREVTLSSPNAASYVAALTGQGWFCPQRTNIPR